MEPKNIKEETMTTKSSESSEIRAAFDSMEMAEQWRSRRGQRDKVNAAANEMMIDVANLRAGNRVLDVAAGTGDQTIMAARRVGPTGYVLATDVSANMLKLAPDAAREAGLTNVETRLMDAENISLDEDSFDAAICRQGLMLFSNPVKALIGMRRVVKPASRVVALVWSSEEKNQYQGIAFGIVRRIGKMPSPAPGQPGMFTLGEPSILEGVFREAGFVHIAIHAVSLRRRFKSATEAVRSVKNPVLQQHLDKLSDAERGQAWVEIEQQFKQLEGPNGLELPGEMLVGVGTK
jgi:ubiquinone/menaquinone biosynthesis C-methylase UbiE